MIIELIAFSITSFVGLSRDGSWVLEVMFLL